MSGLTFAPFLELRRPKGTNGTLTFFFTGHINGFFLCLEVQYAGYVHQSAVHGACCVGCY